MCCVVLCCVMSFHFDSISCRFRIDSTRIRLVSFRSNSILPMFNITCVVGLITVSLLLLSLSIWLVSTTSIARMSILTIFFSRHSRVNIHTLHLDVNVVDDVMGVHSSRDITDYFIGSWWKRRRYCAWYSLRNSNNMHGEQQRGGWINSRSENVKFRDMVYSKKRIFVVYSTKKLGIAHITT